MKVWHLWIGIFAALAAAGSASGADRPGDKFNISPTNLPPPNATPAVDNTSKEVARPANAMPSVPAGFKVSIFASGLNKPRFLAVAPNGDVFVSESDEGKITVLGQRKGKQVRATFARGFSLPHGLAFHDGALYVADLKAVWRIRYRDGALRGPKPIRVTVASSLGRSGGHFTRDIAFDSKGNLVVAIGSHENLGEDPLPEASVQRVGADGGLSTFASGTRNPVGIAFYPGTDDLYVTVNERDGIGDYLPPDYLTHLEAGAFYGWPYAYLGKHPDPDFGKKHPELVARTKAPDLLFQAHSAPLGLVFYEGSQFPADFKGDAFVALHGSWNSSKPTGYKVVRVHFAGGRPAGGYENFLTGFWDGSSSPANVWGRPVGLAIAKDGSLLISDDVGKVIWQVSYVGK